MHIKLASSKTLLPIMTVVAMIGATSSVKAGIALPVPNASSDIVLTVDSVNSSQNLYQSLTSDTTYSQTSGGLQPTASASGTASLNPSPSISVTASVSGTQQQAIAY